LLRNQQADMFCSSGSPTSARPAASPARNISSRVRTAVPAYLPVDAHQITVSQGAQHEPHSCRVAAHRLRLADARGRAATDLHGRRRDGLLQHGQEVHVGGDRAALLVAEIARAERELLIQAYNFNEPRIIAAINAAHRACCGIGCGQGRRRRLDCN
jgi:hypothetical protein